MSTKRWRMVVSDLGGDTVVAELTVEAENWMSALRKARDQMGETGGVPTGSSCAVAPDGRVTVLDPVDRRRFVLTTAKEESFKPTPKSAAPVPADPVPRPDPAPKKKDLSKTMAYVPDAKPAAAPKKKMPARTMAYIPPSALPNPKEVAVGSSAPAVAPAPEPSSPAPSSPAPSSPAPSSPAPSEPAPPVSAEPVSAAPSEPAPPPPVAPSLAPAADAEEGVHAGVAWTLHTRRDADPSENNPLCYRERTFVVAEGTAGEVAEGLAMDRLTVLKKSMEGRPAGIFISLAVFDHAWSGQPSRPPIVTAQMKDWQPGVVIDRPLERLKPRDPSRPPPPPRRRVSTDEQDARLSDAFEACQDLLFVATPIEAVEFVIKLFDQLVPAEASTGALYDIDDDVFRTVVATGPGSEGLKGQSHPSRKGLYGAASRLVGAGLRIDDVASDGRFDASEGRPGLDARNALYLPLSHNNRLLGMIQLVNRDNRDAFTASDADLGIYIGSQLAQFLFKARMRGQG